MVNKLFDQVGGIITVKLKGKSAEKVINMALARGIYLWDIKKTEEGMDFKVRTSGYKALQNIAADNDFSLNIVTSEGLPFYRNLLKRRMGFFGGALIFILALYLLTSFVWFIDVSGNHNIDKKRIILTAAQYGVYQGAAKWNFSRSKMEEGMLKDISELSYAELDIQGVKAHIKVVEKILPKQDITGPCHMVASKDGVIEDVLVLDGQASVKPGDVVGKGDILISGIVIPEKRDDIAEENTENEEGAENKEDSNLPYEVRARGEIKARVWYDGYGECKMKSEKKLLTGQKKKIIYLETPWRTFSIKGQRDTSYPLYTRQIKKNILKTDWGDFALYRITLREQTQQIKEYKERDAVEIARQKAMKVLQKKLGKSHKITDSQVDILSSPSDLIIRVKVSAETIENIAVAQPINVSVSENGN